MSFNSHLPSFPSNLALTDPLAEPARPLGFPISQGLNLPGWTSTWATQTYTNPHPQASDRRMATSDIDHLDPDQFTATLRPALIFSIWRAISPFPTMLYLALSTTSPTTG